MEIVLLVQLLDPHPSEVAAKLLNRKTLQDYGQQFNMIAASWINFMIHDWIDHLENLNEVLRASIDISVDTVPGDGLKSFTSACPLF